MVLWKCCIQYARKSGKLSSGHRTGKGQSVFTPIPKKGNDKECSNYHTITCISHSSKVILKILQARLQQYVNGEFPEIQAWFRKVRGIREQIANSCWIIKKARALKKKKHSKRYQLMQSDPMDYTVHGILQAIILEWVAVPFSRISFQPMGQTQVPCITGRFFTGWATREAQEYGMGSLFLQQIFPTQELKQGLLHCRHILYQPPGKPLS